MVSCLTVVIQVLMIILIGVSGSVVPSKPVFLIGAVLGVLLMSWSLWTMRLSNLNVMPDLKANCILVTHGPYAFIRHPMYAAVLLITLMLILNQWAWLRFVYWIILLVDLHFKFQYEERLLLGKYPQYSAYRQKTKRLIPFVY